MYVVIIRSAYFRTGEENCGRRTLSILMNKNDGGCIWVASMDNRLSHAMDNILSDATHCKLYSEEN